MVVKWCGVGEFCEGSRRGRAPILLSVPKGIGWPRHTAANMEGNASSIKARPSDKVSPCAFA